MNLDKANTTLTRIRIVARGQKLSLQATLPNKSGHGKKQYRIATGYPHNTQGIKWALAQAQKLEADLILERFNWSEWGGKSTAPPKTIGEAIALVHENWEREKNRTDSQRKNFQIDYLNPYQFLPSNKAISENLLREVIETETDPCSRARQRMAKAYQKLLVTVGSDGDLRGLATGYKPNPRTIPSDSEIIKLFDTIPNPQWQWAYGMIAAYGIRPHEIFRLNCEKLGENPPILYVLGKTKTGFRPVLPLPLDWVRAWGLDNVTVPSRVNLDRSNKEIGGTVSSAFRRYQLPFTPYCLRHAFAIRCSVHKISPTLAAKAMGHSLMEHFRQYHRWLGERDLVEGWVSLNHV